MDSPPRPRPPPPCFQWRAATSPTWSSCNLSLYHCTCCKNSFLTILAKKPLLESLLVPFLSQKIPNLPADSYPFTPGAHQPVWLPLSQESVSAALAKRPISGPWVNSQVSQKSVSQLFHNCLNLTILTGPSSILLPPQRTLFSSPSRPKPTFTRLTTLPLAPPTLLPWSWRTKGLKEASSLLQNPISWHVTSSELLGGCTGRAVGTKCW